MVKLLTVIGHGTNLLPHFIEHYQKHVDEINIAVYETELHPNLTEEINEIIKDYDKVNVVITVQERVFDWEKVTQLYNFVKSKRKDSWYVIADIDEFHLYPNDDLRKLIKDCEENNWDIVRGGFIDRIGRGGEFSELVNNVSIWEQFPNAGFFRYPMSQACPNKICVMKGYVDVTAGQHYAKINDHTTWRWQGWSHPLIAPADTHSVQVHHFKWDSTSIDRVLNVANLNEEYSFSNEYFQMYKELKKTNFKIDLLNPDFMFELGLTNPIYNNYKNWNKLIKKIISI
jgi:tellurite resistance-related uncharacterized protein